MKNKCILIVEDEIKIVEPITEYLKANNYDVLKANDGIRALKVFQENKPDMIILDLMLPHISGQEVCKKIRKTSNVPIIMLTAKVSEDDKINGLNIGADDYITKPFSPRELVARVNSLFRRAEKNEIKNTQKCYNSKDLVIDLTAHTVTKNNINVQLTPNEFKILATLSNRANKTFTRQELIELAFDIDFDGFDRTIDSHIKNLRSKIEDNTAKPTYILTVRGVGYKFGGILEES